MGIPRGGPATDVLLNAFKIGETEERLAALPYLKRVANEGIIGALYNGMYGEDPEVREASFYALEEIAANGITIPHPNQFGLGEYKASNSLRNQCAYERRRLLKTDKGVFDVKETLLLTIAVLGGTGKEGKGLAYRWAKAGYKILIGSRISEKAVTSHQKSWNCWMVNRRWWGSATRKLRTQADIVVLTVPYAAHRRTFESVKDSLRRASFSSMSQFRWCLRK